MSRPLIRLALALLAILALPAAALAQSSSWIRTTATYKIILDLGPVETMLTPDQAKGATSGEVMAPMGGMNGMAMPQMAMTDQGHPVNHHLEVHVYNKATGQVLTNVSPTIAIADSMGATRQLSAVVAMYGVTRRPSDYHYGNNLYLANGTYTVVVQIGPEKATFADVTVPGGTASPSASSGAPSGMSTMGSSPNSGSSMSGSATAMPQSTPRGMPNSGGWPVGAALALGAAAVGAGRLLRRVGHGPPVDARSGR